MSKRTKITLAKIHTSGYDGKKKVTSSLILNVAIMGTKQIKERLEEERKKLEEKIGEEFKDKPYTMRSTAKITGTIYVDYFLLGEN